ncbi:MAG TPA: hypothetical protein VGK27_06920 [Candidatus Deferrimicrobiaceae bacterium]|jgi:hypothetical protein
MNLTDRARCAATAGFAFLAVALGATPSTHAAPQSAAVPGAKSVAGKPAPADYRALPKPGARVTLDAGHYFTYGFTKPAKIGVAIMRVEIFTRDGKHDTSFGVKGDADMPSMRGAHTMGDKDFALSKKGDYLLPIPLVMPGDWEVRLTFVKDGKTVLRGAYLFDL